MSTLSYSGCMCEVLTVQVGTRAVCRNYWQSASECKGNIGRYLPEWQRRVGRYHGGIAQRANEYEVGISFIAYTFHTLL